MLKVGDIVNGCCKTIFVQYVVASICKEKINGAEYNVYNLDNGHLLYVKKNVTINLDDNLDLFGHVICFPEDKITMKDDYFILANLGAVLPI